jgi:hypothetical protein
MALRPWLKFYPSDWRADPALRMCSLASRGLWMEMLCLMHEATLRGSLLINGQAVTDKQLASLCGVSSRDVTTCLEQLESAGVFSREDNGTIFSRRMRRDDEKAERDKANGKGGGNPILKGGVNPPDKAQILEARNQKERKDAAPTATAPEVELFRRGKEILGPSSGGLIKNLIKAKKGSIPLARAAIETASTKHNPREYIGGIKRDRAARRRPSQGGRMVIDDLEKLGIRVRNQNGEQRTTCPQCSHTRQKKRDRCLVGQDRC